MVTATGWCPLLCLTGAGAHVFCSQVAAHATVPLASSRRWRPNACAYDTHPWLGRGRLGDTETQRAPAGHRAAGAATKSTLHLCDVAAICRRVKQIQAKMPQLLEATVGTRMPYTALTQEATVRRTFAQSVSR